MAESKRTFQSARMDKDVDDRLLKSGQYRDGLNITIDTSEDANVGAVENLKGNELIANQTIYGLSAASNPNAKVIGSFAHPEEQKIYYFVTGDNADGIFEYDVVNAEINTIVIDSLNLSTAETTELNFADASPSASIAQDGTIFVSSDIGNPKVITSKFSANTTGSAIDKDVSISIEVPSVYKNSNEYISGSVTASQPTKTAPEVITQDVKTIANTTATLAGSLTNNSVSVTSQGFYYGYKTDGGTLTLSELKNGGTGITRSTVTITSIKNNFTSDITGLVADKQISYVAWATNSIGTTDGDIKTFTTANTSFSITSLGFVNSTVANTGGSEEFTVSGTPNAEYTLTGSVGATAPSGTHTIDGSGSSTHSITIAAQNTGDPARTPTVTVATAGTTVFLPSDLTTSDTISQAAGAAQTYTYALTPSESIGNSTLKQTAESTGTTYTGFTTTQPANYSATETFYIFPDAGYEFANASSVSVTNLPSWASATITQDTNTDNHTYIKVDIAISNTPTNDDSVTYNITATPTQVTTTWSSGLWTASTNPSASISPTSDSSISFTGTGTKTTSDTISVTDSGKYISGVNSTTKNSTYGGDIITVSYSGIPTSSGGSFTVSFSIAIPTDQRKSITYSSAPVAISLAGATSQYLHRLNYTIAGSNWSLRLSSNPTSSTVTKTDIYLTPGATWFSTTVYAHPNQGYKFSSASDASISGLPSWASVSKSLVTTSTGSYIAITVSFTGQSSAQTATSTITGSPGQAVITFNNKMIVFNTSGYTGTSSPVNAGAGQTFTGPGPHTITFSSTVSGATPGSAVYDENSTGPHAQYTTGATNISGTTVSATLTLSQPFRIDKTYTTTLGIASIDIED